MNISNTFVAILLSLLIPVTITAECCNSQNSCVKFKQKIRAYCALLAQDLQVPGSGYIANLTANTLRVTDNALISGNLTVNGTIFTEEALNFGDITIEDLTVNGTFTANGISNIGTNSTNDAINIGTVAATGGRDIVIGNTVPGSSLVLNGGVDNTTASGVAVSGTTSLISILSFNSTNHDRVGQVGFTGNTLASGATANIVISNNTVTINSRVLATLFYDAASTDTRLIIRNIVVTGNAMTITIQNIGTVGLAGGDIVFVNFWVLNS